MHVRKWVATVLLRILNGSASNSELSFKLMTCYSNKATFKNTLWMQNWTKWVWLWLVDVENGFLLLWNNMQERKPLTWLLKLHRMKWSTGKYNRAWIKSAWHVKITFKPRRTDLAFSVHMSLPPWRPSPISQSPEHGCDLQRVQSLMRTEPSTDQTKTSS